MLAPALKWLANLFSKTGRRHPRQVDSFTCSQSHLSSSWCACKKTGKLLDVPVIDELAAELKLTPRTSPVMVISETTGKPYGRHNFSHLFREIARAAGLRDELQFLDLRRTAAVRLAEAGCDLKEIAHITGHSYDRVKIFEVYLPRQRAVAQDAIVRLSEHRKRTKLEGSKP